VSDFGTRLAGSAGSGAELGVSDFALRNRQEDRNYYVAYTPNKAVIPSASPLAIPVSRVMDQVETMFLRKNQDYGPDAISGAPFGVLEGLLTRMHDKYSRAVNLVRNGHNTNYEPLEDCFRDLIGYSVAAVLYLNKEWPGVKYD
jgi:hypothetical protein